MCAGTATFCGVYFTHKSTTCTAREPDGSTGDEGASSGSGGLVEAADEASPCSLREAARHAWRRCACSGSDRSGLSAAGGVCSVSTHLAGKSALEEAVVRVMYVPSDVRVSGRSVHCQCVSDAIRSAAYSPPIGRFCFR